MSDKKKVRIALDYGHGGKDPGYVTSDGKVQEKEISRQIGSKVAFLLEEQGYEVILTREEDATRSLGERTSFANQKRADVFFSLHANSGSAAITGVETFYFDPSLLKNEFEKIDFHTKNALVKTTADWHCMSKELAQDVQDAVLESTHAADRHIKKGVIQVLLGFQGPAALIEVGYLTNERERALLCSGEYQKRVAKGIFEGIKMFIDKHFA